MGEEEGEEEENLEESEEEAEVGRRARRMVSTRTRAGRRVRRRTSLRRLRVGRRTLILFRRARLKRRMVRTRTRARSRLRRRTSLRLQFVVHDFRPPTSSVTSAMTHVSDADEQAEQWALLPRVFDAPSSPKTSEVGPILKKPCAPILKKNIGTGRASQGI